MRSPPRIRVWTAPALLGLMTAVGLIAALVSDGVGDLLSWFALALPVAIVLWCVPPRRAQDRDRSGMEGR